MEVADRPLLTDEEARCAVADSFTHLWQRERDLTHVFKVARTHAGEPRTRRGDDAVGAVLENRPEHPIPRVPEHRLAVRCPLCLPRARRIASNPAQISTRSTFDNGLVEQQDLLLVGTLKNR